MKAKTKKNSSPTKGEVSYRSSSRSNGWTCPSHPLQFVAWIFIAFFAVMFNGMAVSTIPYHWQPACYIIANMTLLIHIVTHLICLTINPADPNTLRRHKTTMPTFDRNQHSHVIENNHCYLCEVDVGIKSKHCSSCNKCVADFDHHCKWLNNCVGSRNYRWFITCLSSAFLCCLLVFIVFLYLSIVYWVNPRLLHPDLLDAVSTTILPTHTAEFSTATPSSVTTLSPYTTSDPLKAYRNGLAIFSEVSGTAFFVVSIIITVLLFVTLCLLGHLLAFHLYLIYNRMSTYDYVMQDRNLFNSADPESQRPRRRSRICCKCNNQVSPLQEGKEEIELTNTKKNDTTDQLESNNSNGNLQQHFVVSEPLIKQQQEQQQEHVQTSTAVTESKPKKRKRTRRKPHHQRSLTVHESLQPSLMGHGYPPTGMNLAHSMPQTYLEQHLVRRYSLPLVGPPGMRTAYPTDEPVQDLFFTQQFPTMPQPTTNPQRRANPRPQATPHLAPITIDSPTPAQDYHSSSAESLTEIPLGRPQMDSFDGYPKVGRYPYPHEKLHPGYKSHPDLILSGQQWQPNSGWNQRNLNNSYVKKTKRKLPPRIEDGASYKRVNRNETSKDSNDELRTKTSQASKPKTSTISMSTIADVHHEPENPVRLNTNRTNDTFEPHSKPKFTERANNSEVSRGSVETRSNEDQKPIAAPRKRTLKPGQTPSSSQSKSQALERSSSQQHLLESDNRDIVPRSAKLKPQGDDVSISGANPKNGSPLDHLGSSGGHFKSLDPLKPVASRRSILLRY